MPEPTVLAARLASAAPREGAQDPIESLRRREQKLRAEANGQQELL
jgi:hypothetical protein